MGACKSRPNIRPITAEEDDNAPRTDDAHEVASAPIKVVRQHPKTSGVPKAGAAPKQSRKRFSTFLQTLKKKIRPANQAHVATPAGAARKRELMARREEASLATQDNQQEIAAAPTNKRRSALERHRPPRLVLPPPAPLHSRYRCFEAEMHVDANGPCDSSPALTASSAGPGSAASSLEA